ncbi:MAG: alpha/beta hydrolase [bacterium]|nr:alpha/beta hydrolase [bacterium]
MPKRVFIVHGWDDSPEAGWFPWLRKELEAKGFEVIAPQLPDAAYPRMKNWVPALAEAVGTPDDQTFFIGHSMGCQTIIRYLETVSEEVKVGGAVFVAGFLKRLSGLEDDSEVQEIAKEWLETPIDLEKVKTYLDKSIAIFSDNDRYVPLDNQDDFKEKLGSKIIIVSGMKHFAGSSGFTELPIARDSLLEIAQ